MQKHYVLRTGKRHWLLVVLCFLSFIGGIMNVFLSVISIIHVDTFQKLIYYIPGFSIFIMQTTEVSQWYFFWRAVIYLVSIIGVINMYLLRREGFFIYVLAQILLFVNIWTSITMPFSVVVVSTLPEMVITLGFILLYAVHLDSMARVTSVKKLFLFWR